MEIQEAYKILKTAFKKEGKIATSKLKECRKLIFPAWVWAGGQIEPFDYQVGKIYHDLTWSIKVLSKTRCQILQLRDPVTGKALFTA